MWCEARSVFGSLRVRSASQHLGCEWQMLHSLVPVGQHGTQRLLDRHHRLPTGVLAEFPCTTEDNLLVRGTPQMLGGTDFRFHARETNRSAQQLANLVRRGCTQVVGLTPFPLHSREVKAANCVVYVKECAARGQVPHFNY